MSSKSFLRLENITKSFYRWGQKVKALDNICSDIHQGQWIMLLGHNGSGKTTLLDGISSKLKPDSGDIFINGKSISKLSHRELAKYIFYVHQDPLLGTAPTLTLYENLLIADERVDDKKLPRRKLKNIYRDLLRPLGLENRLKQLAKDLSGGERQLITLLIAQLRPSQLILLDEPLSALDPNRTKLCIELIKKLHMLGKTIIQVSHDIDLALKNGNRIIMMEKGKIIYDQSGNYDEHLLRHLWTTDYNGDNIEGTSFKRE